MGTRVVAGSRIPHSAWVVDHEVFGIIAGWHVPFAASSVLSFHHRIYIMSSLSLLVFFQQLAGICSKVFPMPHLRVTHSTSKIAHSSPSI